MALEKDFLRFMLSDGASCALLENHPGEKGVSLKIEWIEMDSYANETPTCMFAGAVRREDGELKSWKSFESQELVDESLMVIKHYANEADVLNMALFGMTAKQWRDSHPDLKGNIRDYANVSQLVCLSNLENLNAVLRI